MCTVTYLPTAAGCIISSNRDELMSRNKVLMPQWYHNGTKELIYPKDLTSGGTWIVADQFGATTVLLNGATVKHKSTPPYRKSRGIILLEISGSTCPIAAINEISLQQIEPFSLIHFGNNQLVECLWDGKSKSIRTLDVTNKYIWSSVTLYDRDESVQRKKHFAGWQRLIPFPTEADLLDLHQHLLLEHSEGYKREHQYNDLKTLSITSVNITPFTFSISYHDLIENTSAQHTATISSTSTYSLEPDLA